MKTVLLFDPAPPRLRWVCYNEGILDSGVCDPDNTSISSVSTGLRDKCEIDAVGYVLYNGGKRITNSGEIVTSPVLASLEGSIGILPEYNELTYKAVNNTIQNLRSVPHIVLCETGLFSNMPPESSTYAVPAELRERELRRYGGYGLEHEWSLAQTKRMVGTDLKRIVSVYLGGTTNVAAILEGNAVETSIGFTPIEGIISEGGCGDIDPTVVFYLLSSGFSLHETNHLLLEESGFKALLGKSARIEDVVGGHPGKSYDFAYRLYTYQVLKSIGAFVSVLGGVDAIVFSSSHTGKYMKFMRGLCNQLEFLGVTCSGSGPEKQPFVLSSPDSRVKVLCFAYDRWEMLAEKTNHIINMKDENHD
jgi:acetate kinase